MKRLFSSLLLLILILPALAQSKRERYVDSLKSILEISTPIQNLEHYARLAEQYRNMSLDSADKYAHIGEDLATELGNDNKLIQFYDLLGQIHHLKGQYLISAKYFNDGLERAIQTENTKMTVFLKNSVGISLMTVGSNQRALALLRDAKIGFEEMGKKQPVVSSLINMGGIYLKEESFDLAIDAYKEALAISIEINKKRLISSTLKKLGQVYADLDSYDSANVYYQRALAVALEKSYTTQTVSIFNALARLEITKENYDLAALYHVQAHAVVDSEKNLFLIQYINEGQGDLERAKNNSLKALKYYTESFRIAETLKSKTRMMTMHKKLSDYYKEIGDSEKALIHFEGYHDLQQAFQKDEDNKRADEIEAKHLLDQREKQIETLEKEKIERQLVNYGLSMMIILVLGLLLVLYSRYRNKKKTSKALQDYNQKIKLQNNLLENQREALDDQNDQLRRANSDLEQFVYIASHDLREPLRTINSYIGLLKLRYKDKLDEHAHDFIDFATEGVERLNELLVDLLEYSRIGHRGAHHVAIDLNTVLHKVLHGLNKQIQDSNAKIEVPDLPTLPGFELELHLLFQNVISNAIKFSKADQTPHITIKAKKEDDSFWTITIKDDGIGMDQTYHEKVFAIFQRLNIREKYAGTGIGLAICKRIVENHKGQIWFESEKGEGTTFFIKLPAF